MGSGLLRIGAIILISAAAIGLLAQAGLAEQPTLEWTKPLGTYVQTSPIV